MIVRKTDIHKDMKESKKLQKTLKKLDFQQQKAILYETKHCSLSSQMKAATYSKSKSTKRF